MIILCDIDGVIANLHLEWYRIHNENCKVCDRPLDVSDVTRWNTHEFVACGKDIYQYLWDDRLYDAVKPIAGTHMAIGMLRNRGHKVIFVTSGLQPAKIAWLVNNGFIEQTNWRSSPDWIIANDKSVFQADLMIDDYYGNLDKFKGHTLLFDAPWNRDVTNHTRVRNWYETYITIKGLEFKLQGKKNNGP